MTAREPMRFYGWVGDNADGVQGIVTGFMVGVGIVEMSGVTRETADVFRPMAQEVAIRRGRPLRLVQFVEAETVDVVYAQPGGRA